MCVCFQGHGRGAEEKKRGSRLTDVKRRGRMERSREDEEEMTDRLKMLVRHGCRGTRPLQ